MITALIQRVMRTSFDLYISSKINQKIKNKSEGPFSQKQMSKTELTQKIASKTE